MSNTTTCICSVCKLEHPSTINGTKHRRCGGGKGEPPKAKYAPRGTVRGYWEQKQP